MSMIKCKECGAQISSKAESCPHCGYEKEKLGCMTILFITSMGFIILLLIGSIGGENRRGERIERGFRGWDGSHIALQRWIKRNLKDPDSYEHIETRYSDNGDYIIVQTKYRARNSFGGMTIGSARARASLDGEIMQILQSE